MRLAFFVMLIASLAHADTLPDVVFDAARGNLSTITLVDGCVLIGEISSFDAQYVALIDPTTQAVRPIARADIASVRLGDEPQPVVPAPRLSVPHAPRLSVLTDVGLGIASVAYGAALVGGISYVSWNHVEIDRGRDAGDPSLYKQGYELVVPIVGPFLSAAASQGYPSSWQGAWITDGIVQIAGLSIMIAGLVQQRSHAAPLAFRGVTFTPSVTPQSVGLSGSF